MLRLDEVLPPSRNPHVRAPALNSAVHRPSLETREKCGRMTPSLILALDTIVVVDLPVTPPVLPMLAKWIEQLPPGDEWIFEPKWDGFRALVFRDNDEILIQSRDEKPLNRYFPELIEPLKAGLPSRCV